LAWGGGGEGKKNLRGASVGGPQEAPLSETFQGPPGREAGMVGSPSSKRSKGSQRAKGWARRWGGGGAREGPVAGWGARGRQRGAGYQSGRRLRNYWFWDRRGPEQSGAEHRGRVTEGGLPGPKQPGDLSRWEKKFRGGTKTSV